MAPSCLPCTVLDPRMRLSIEMALTGHRGIHALMRRQDEAATRLGLRGAEIDAARAGRSFDLRIARALELAIALRRGDGAAARSRAIGAGLDEAACREIARLARAHVESDRA